LMWFSLALARAAFAAGRKKDAEPKENLPRALAEAEVGEDGAADTPKTSEACLAACSTTRSCVR